MQLLCYDGLWNNVMFCTHRIDIVVLDRNLVITTASGALPVTIMKIALTLQGWLA